MKATNLVGRKVIGQHGRDIGVVGDLIADADKWQLQTLEIRLNRTTLEELKFQVPWFGTQVV